MVRAKGAAKAPLPLRKVVAVPELVPSRAAGMVPVVAEPRAVTMSLPAVALLAIVSARDPAVFVTSPVCAGIALVGKVVTGLVGANGVDPVM